MALNALQDALVNVRAAVQKMEAELALAEAALFKCARCRARCGAWSRLTRSPDAPGDNEPLRFPVSSETARSEHTHTCNNKPDAAWLTPMRRQQCRSRQMRRQQAFKLRVQVHVVLPKQDLSVL